MSSGHLELLQFFMFFFVLVKLEKVGKARKANQHTKITFGSEEQIHTGRLNNDS